MELARDRNESQARHSNCRRSGIARARVESRCALVRNGRMPSRPARDAGFLEGTANRCARLADQRSRRALQQARGNQAGWRPVSYDVLSCAPAWKTGAILCVAFFTMAFEPPSPEIRRAAIGDLSGLSPVLRRAFSADASEFWPIPKPGPHDWLAVHPESGQTFDEFKASGANRPTESRRVIYLQPLGEFAADVRQTILSAGDSQTGLSAPTS